MILLRKCGEDDAAGCDGDDVASVRMGLVMAVRERSRKKMSTRTRSSGEDKHRHMERQESKFSVNERGVETTRRGAGAAEVLEGRLDKRRRLRDLDKSVRRKSSKFELLTMNGAVEAGSYGRPSHEQQQRMFEYAGGEHASNYQDYQNRGKDESKV
ncbi:hypothetical protein K443DRAFT_126421 [Laccaria amethystina LaAM-08-1]|uniref:Uncharacterized protein n=1 Tax=Laccaria amethystina LaAM-08-1 TaxID=1095629 RepID=A0A0C9WS26_9AGAR|nr:hypothetical protein K443DRAFT_126421 [Laccaria amethystina LaAM-08-1]